MWALIDATAVGWGSGATHLKLTVGAILLCAFIAAERLQQRPMVDLSLFRDRTFVGAAIAMLGYAGTAQVMMTILPLYLQDAFGQSPAVAGLAMIPFALPLLIFPTIGGKLSASMSGRALLTVGLAMVALGNAVTAPEFVDDVRQFMIKILRNDCRDILPYDLARRITIDALRCTIPT